MMKGIDEKESATEHTASSFLFLNNNYPSIGVGRTSIDSFKELIPIIEKKVGPKGNVDVFAARVGQDGSIINLPFEEIQDDHENFPVVSLEGVDDPQIIVFSALSEYRQSSGMRYEPTIVMLGDTDSIDGCPDSKCSLLADRYLRNGGSVPPIEESLQLRYDLLIMVFRGITDLHRNNLVFTDLSGSDIAVIDAKGGTGERLMFVSNGKLRNCGDFYSDDGADDGGITILSKDSDVLSAVKMALAMLSEDYCYEDTGDSNETDAYSTDDYPADDEDDEIDGIFEEPSFGLCTSEGIRRILYRALAEGRHDFCSIPAEEDFSEEFQRANGLIITCPECGRSMIIGRTWDGRCSHCNAAVEDMVVMRIRYKMTGRSVPDCINAICPSEETAIDDLKLVDDDGHEYSIFDRTGDYAENGYVLSEIAVPKGEIRTLMRFHIESGNRLFRSTGDRSDNGYQPSDTADPGSETEASEYHIEDDNSRLEPILSFRRQSSDRVSVQLLNEEFNYIRIFSKSKSVYRDISSDKCSRVAVKDEIIVFDERIDGDVTAITFAEFIGSP